GGASVSPAPRYAPPFAGPVTGRQVARSRSSSPVGFLAPGNQGRDGGAKDDRNGPAAGRSGGRARPSSRARTENAGDRRFTAGVAGKAERLNGRCARIAREVRPLPRRRD